MISLLLFFVISYLFFLWTYAKKYAHKTNKKNAHFKSSGY